MCRCVMERSGILVNGENPIQEICYQQEKPFFSQELLISFWMRIILV